MKATIRKHDCEQKGNSVPSKRLHSTTTVPAEGSQVSDAAPSRRHHLTSSQSRCVRIILVCLSYMVLFFVVLLCTSALWLFRTWDNISVEELIFHARVNMGGAAGNMVALYVVGALLPAVATVMLVIGMFRVLKRRLTKKHLVIVRRGVCAALLCLLIVTSALLWTKLDITTYIENQTSESVFIEENYVDPDEVTITFPTDKRNLIYIYLESMVVTYSDTDSGGAFPENLIPNLTALAETGEDFSGDSETLNGAYNMPNTTWTISSLFSQTTGLPIPTSADLIAESYLPGITALGDILEEEGYRQVFMCGSDIRFADRKEYLIEHGDYELLDYYYAIKAGWIPSDYKVWWGYEDEKLFSFAKEELSELAGGQEPFNLTLLSVDTHMEDGFVCELCEDTYDSRYANVIACSDRQVAAFVAWCQEQDWYQNTTIVISGDHPTMDADFCDGVDESYTRLVYTNYLNSAVTPADSSLRRDYTTFDDFPTTLAALGAKIEGNRLGLGTNLFSELPTLTEEFGREDEETELSRPSEFMSELVREVRSSGASSQDSSEGSSAETVPHATVAGMYDENNQSYYLVVSEIDGIDDVRDVYVTYKSYDSNDSGVDSAGVTTRDLELLNNGMYDVTLDMEGTDIRYLDLSVFVRDGQGSEYEIYHTTGRLSIMIFDPDSYIEHVSELLQMDSDRYSVLIAARGSACADIMPTQQEALAQLGITSEFNYEALRFAAVIDGGTVTEEMREDEVVLSGTLAAYSTTSDEDAEESETLSTESSVGVVYYLESGEDTCVLELDGTDYAFSRDGLQFVVYDKEIGVVVDAVNFDLGDALVEREGYVRNFKTTYSRKGADCTIVRLRHALEDNAYLRLCLVICWRP